MAYQYIGQCNIVRRCGPEHEERWQHMIASSKSVPLDEFVEKVDMTPLLDEDDTPASYLRDATRADPTTRTYRSVWGDQACYFLQTAGFEFIFVEAL